MSDLQARLAALPPDKRKLLEQKLLHDGARMNIFPASFAQRRLWFLDQWAPGSAAYHLPAALHLHGALDVAALQQSLDALIARHEALRTTFLLLDGQPAQQIQPPAPLALPIHDAPAAARDAQLAALAARPFDLARGPLLRATLLRHTPAHATLLLVLHHIAVDGWSLGVLVRELARHYQAAHAGQPCDRRPAPIQYADYAHWQRAQLQGAPLARLLAYWRAQLQGLPTLALPTDHARPAVPTFRSAELALALAPELVARLTQLAHAAGATLFMVLLAALDLLLFWYTGQDDLVVGADIANRTQAETEALIGFFVNMLALRCDLSGDPSFATLLARVRTVCLDAYAHQDLPIDLLINELQPTRSLQRAPLFQVVLVLQNTPLPPLVLDGVQAEPQAVDPGIAKFDLVFELREGPAGTTGLITYDTDLFEAATIARMAGQFVALLDSAAQQPGARLSVLTAQLDEAERRAQLSQAQALRTAQQGRLKAARRKALTGPHNERETHDDELR
jgi:hypothetical protein